MANIIQTFPVGAGGSAEYPAGGTTGQALVKASNADNDVTWGNASSTLVINVVGSNSTWTADKKPSEVQAAIDNGNAVQVLLDNHTNSKRICDLSVIADDDSGSTEYRFSYTAMMSVTDPYFQGTLVTMRTSTDGADEWWIIAVHPNDTWEYPIVTSMPTPSSTFSGKIVMYKGSTTPDYTKGYYYQCVQDGGTYKWVQKNVQPGIPKGGTTGQVLAKTSDADNAIGWTDIDNDDAAVKYTDTLPTDPDIKDKFYRVEDDGLYVGNETEQTTERVALYAELPEEVPHWVGTMSQYEANKNSIPEGTFVALTDDIDQNYESGDYSTNEVNTGKRWINGKPIYRKVYQWTGVGMSDGESVMIPTSNLPADIDIYNAWIDYNTSYCRIHNNGGTRPLCFSYNKGAQTINCWFTESGVKWDVRGFSSSGGADKVYITIEYTKLTD